MKKAAQKNGSMKIENRNSLSLQRDPKGTVIALIVAGQRYEINEDRFTIPEQIAGRIVLKDLDFDIKIDIEDHGKSGIVCNTVRRIPISEWSVIMMVRYSLADWNGVKSLSNYANQVWDAIKKREKTHNDVICIDKHVRIDHFHVCFAVKAIGMTIRDLLDDAQKYSSKFIPLQK
jgi:hypothetical protein